MSYGRYFLIRLTWALIGFLLACLVVFVTFRVVQPAPLSAQAGELTPSDAQYYDRVYGHPAENVPGRFARFLGDFLDDGSIEASPTASYPSTREQVFEALPATAALVLPGLGLAFLVAFGYGFLWARSRSGERRPWSWPVYLSVGAFPTGLGLWLAALLAAHWNWFSVPNFWAPGMGGGGGGTWTERLPLAWLTFGLFFAAVYSRMLRHFVRRVLAADDDQKAPLARSGGITMARTIGFDIGAGIGLAVFAEVVFQIPGVGRLVVIALEALDFPLAETALLYAALTGIGVHFLVDVVVAGRDAITRGEWRVVAPVEEPA
jgi:ABC-type dipeptide/oligopeptide/nickel transport system permease component